MAPSEIAREVVAPETVAEKAPPVPPENPAPIAKITKTSRARSFYFDPSIVEVPEYCANAAPCPQNSDQEDL